MIKYNSGQYSIVIGHSWLINFEPLKAIGRVELLGDNGLSNSHHLSCRFTKIVTFFPQTVLGYIADIKARYPAISCFESSFEHFHRRYELVGRR